MPSVIKTWQFISNLTRSATGTQYTDCKWQLLMIKNALTTFTSNAWTVSGSCGSVIADGSTMVAGFDAVDRWAINLVGTDTNANVNTSTNNTLRVRSSPLSPYYVIAVTAGASTAKTTIVSDLNTAFSAVAGV